MVLGTRLRNKFIKAVTEGNEAAVKTALSTRDPTTLLALLSTDIQPGRCAVVHATAAGYASVVKHLLAAAEALPCSQEAHSRLRSLHSQAKYYAHGWDDELRRLVLHHTEACIDIMAVAAASGGTCPPLYAAARRGDVAQLQQLLADGETDSLISSPCPSWMPTYVWRGVATSALEAAAAAQDQHGHGSAAAVQLLVSAASPEQLEGQRGFAALLAAVKGNSGPEVVTVLLSAGVPTALDREAALPRSASCTFDTFKAVVTAVQQRGGSLDEADAAMGTALEYVVRWGKVDFVELLLQRGADVNAAGRDGTTALLEAVSMRSPQMVQMLLAAGADAGAVGPDALSALALAAQCVSVPLVNMMLEHSTTALPASALINAAWEAAGVPFYDDEDSEWDEEDEDEELYPAECRRVQDSIVSSLLKAAAVRDPVATAAALADCSQQVAELYKEAKQNFDTAGGCSCGCCPQPDPVDPALIQRSSVMLKALSGLWLGPSLVVADVTAQQAAVQHMLVVTASSLKQQQEQQRQLQAVDELDERERQLAARERQVARREQQVAANEQQQRAGKSKRARPAAATPAAAAVAGPATRSKRARTAAGGAGTKG